MKEIESPFEIIRLQDVIINRDFFPILKENHLTSLPSLMNYPEGQVVKSLIPQRSVVNFALKGVNQTIDVYLKRYYPTPFSEQLKSPLTLFSSYTALREWNNILTFYKLNLPTVTPIATGMRRRSIFAKESFLLTRGLEGVTRLDDVIPERFSPPLHPESISEKRELISKLALLTQKMHNLGFNHRDFYLCHILTRTNTLQGWELFICDLHRVNRRKKVGMRWRVKDLAALNYSAPVRFISTNDRIRFMKKYLGKEKLDEEARSWIKNVVRKTEKMKRHNVKRKS